MLVAVCFCPGSCIRNEAQGSHHFVDFFTIYNCAKHLNILHKGVQSESECFATYCLSKTVCNSSKNEKLSSRMEQDGVADILQLEHEGPTMKIGTKKHTCCLNLSEPARKH